MRVLVTGSRSWAEAWVVWGLLEGIRLTSGPFELVHGDAPRGADHLADKWARANPAKVRCFRVPADWDRHGRAAGAIRNREMLEKYEPDLVVAFFAGDTPGTRNMVELARRAGVRVVEVWA